MARLWSGGFELNNVMEFSGSNGAPATIQSSIKRSGGFAGKILNPASGTRTGWYQRLANGAVTDCYMRCPLYVVAFPNQTTTIFDFSPNTSMTGTSTSNFRVTLSSGGVLTFIGADGTTVDTETINTGQWYVIEARSEGIAASGSNVTTVRLDGVQVGTYTADSNDGSAHSIRWGANVQAETATTGEWYFDDLAGNSTSGGDQNSWPGHTGAIVHLYPNAAGDFAEGDSGPSTGLSGISQVGETPTPDDATTYWELQADSSANSSSASRLDVNCESFAPSASSIVLVQVGGRVRGETATSCSWVPRIKSQPSGTVVEGTTTTLASASFNTHDDTAGTKQHKLTRYTDPQAGGAWTVPLLNSMQIGARAPDGNPDVHISSLWALVEYVPAAGIPDVSSWDAEYPDRHLEGVEMIPSGASPGGAA